MIVQRIRISTGSYVEPPLDPRASDLDKLRWLAAVVEHDGALPEGTFRFSIAPDHKYALSWTIGSGTTSCAAQPFREVWRHLTAMRDGAAIAHAIREWQES